MCLKQREDRDPHTKKFIFPAQMWRGEGCTNLLFEKFLPKSETYVHKKNAVQHCVPRHFIIVVLMFVDICGTSIDYLMCTIFPTFFS